MAKRQRMIQSDTLPDAYERHALFNSASEAFVKVEYERIEVDHFAAIMMIGPWQVSAA